MKTQGAVTRRTSMAPEMQTPPTLFDRLWTKYQYLYGGFTLDPCCQPNDPTAKRVLANGGRIFVPSEEIAVGGEPEFVGVDGLSQPWHGVVWMNPPYDRTLKLWVEKAVNEVKAGNARLVVALLPSSTGTPWWQKHVITSLMEEGGWASQLADVEFLPGRQRFSWEGEPMKHVARFASVVVVWGNL